MARKQEIDFELPKLDDLFTTQQGIKKALFTVLSRSFQRRDREHIHTAS